MLQKQITDRLSLFQDPYLGKTLGESKAIKRVDISADKVEIDITFGYPIESIQDQIKTQLQTFLASFGLSRTIFKLRTQIEPHVGKQGVASLPNIKNMIAIASGKGGVGKSLIANNLAVALVQEKMSVGMLDADVYGPSQPAMLNALGEKPIIQDKSFVPIKKQGMQSMSIGYLVNQDAAMVWRGPMLAKAMQQMVQETKWENLDYLIVDLPPGTGDIQLTLCQKMPLSGAIVITTPQEMALLDVRRACEMFRKLDIPILGVIENMSHFTCEQCGHAQSLFSEGAAKKLASEFDIPLLGCIPFDKTLHQKTDEGKACDFQIENKLFNEIARKAMAKLALMAKDYSHKFPKIVVKE